MKSSQPRTSQCDTIEVPPLAFRAEISSFNEEDRTVELVFSTGAAVQRYDWNTGKRYIEKLSMEPKAVRLTRLNQAGPLLDGHSGWSVRSQFGAIVEGTARIEKGKGVSSVRFSRRPEAMLYLQDVRDKVIRSFSVGYNVHKYEEETTGTGELPVRNAIDWEPFEVSMVPMPADIGAKARNGNIDGILTTRCVLVRSYSDADRDRRLRLARANTRIA